MTPSPIVPKTPPPLLAELSVICESMIDTDVSYCDCQ